MEKFKEIIKFSLSLGVLIVLMNWDTWMKHPELVDTIHRGNTIEPASLDPHFTHSLQEANIQRDIFEGLTAEAPNGAIIPGVAQKWETSKDQLVWTFHLRHDAKWSNGDPVTAHDFVTAFRRVVDPKVGSSMGLLLKPLLNASKILKKEMEFSKLGVRAINDYTLEIQLEEPVYYLLDLLTNRVAYPVPGKVYDRYKEKWTDPKNIVCNGPYRLKEWVSHEYIQLVKNENYWDPKSVKTPNIFYYPTEDRYAELWRFTTGKLHTTETIPQDQIEWIAKNIKSSFRNTVYPGIMFYAFNMKIEPFKSNLKLRQALAMAIDRDALIEKEAKLSGTPAYSLIPKGMGNYSPQEAFFAAMSQEEREEQAKELFEQAGFSSQNPLKIEILVNSRTLPATRVVANMWKEVLNIDVSIQKEEWKEYVNRRKNKNFQMIAVGGVVVLPTARDFLEMFMSDITQNVNEYSNFEFDHLVETGIHEMSLYERNNWFGKAEALLLNDFPVIPLYHGTTRHLVSPKIRGWKDNFMDVHPSRYLYIVRDKEVH